MIKKNPELLFSCTACSACYNICSKNAITFQEDKEGFKYPNINEDICIHCGLCETVCPELKHEQCLKKNEIKKAFYGWHLDDTIRANSSSGGIFSALAEKAIEKEGIIYGAFYDINNQIVKHTSSIEVDYTFFRKSKYVQSYIGDILKKVKEDLNRKKIVLYTGTPCQISGLLSFLGKEYENLITCDFICHGVPPMRLLNEHIKYHEKKKRDKIIQIDFRPKTLGWSRQTLKLVFNCKREKIVPSSLDGYFNAFYRNISLRKCCYECSYSAETHLADLTLADFWGYRSLNSELNDEKGLGLVLANTDKGLSFIEEAKNLHMVSIEKSYSNYAFHKRRKETYNWQGRTNFYAFYINIGWKKTIKKLKLEGSLKTRIKYKIYSTIKRINFTKY